jgi:hypothetical protein
MGNKPQKAGTRLRSCKTGGLKTGDTRTDLKASIDAKIQRQAWIGLLIYADSRGTLCYAMTVFQRD